MLLNIFINTHNDTQETSPQNSTTTIKLNNHTLSTLLRNRGFEYVEQFYWPVRQTDTKLGYKSKYIISSHKWIWP